MSDKQVLQDLIDLSCDLGKPENDYAILGEGNTSAKLDDEFFYVKASGKYLRNADAGTFVKVKLKKALKILDKGELTDDQIKDELLAACANPDPALRASIETTFHAYLLTLPNVNFVGHTHATAVNALLCSVNAQQIIEGGRLFPDEVVYCGEPIFMEYADPGLSLGKKIREQASNYMEKHGQPPKVILVRNHGIIAIGKTAHQVEAITAMWCKVAQVLVGAVAFGGVNYLPQKEVDRILTRPDEEQRLKQFK